MTRRSTLGGAIKPVTSIVNGGSATVANANNAISAANCSVTLSGPTTAGTLKTAYSATGAGRVNFLAASCLDATSRTIRIKVTINGSYVAYDKTSSAISASGSGVVAIGSAVTGGSSVCLQPIDYTSGVLIEFASSLTETDKLSIGINAEVRQ